MHPGLVAEGGGYRTEIDFFANEEIFNKKGVEWYKVSQLYNKQHKKANTSIEHMVSNLCAASDS